MFIDTHTHLYDEQFANDRNEIVSKAIIDGVNQMYLPNCDSTTLQPMLDLCVSFPNNCFPMIGLHPCSVKANYKEELDVVCNELIQRKYYGIGEVGLDYYWDTTFAKEQQEAFTIQTEWALQYDLPVIIHTRNSLSDGIKMISEKQNGNLQGIFHCFGGTLEEAKQIIDLGFLLGIGGVLTFKNSTLPQVLKEIDLQYIVLETDSPYLAPTPYRGKRNESAYIPLIAEKLALIKECSVAEIAEITTANATRLFK